MESQDKNSNTKWSSCQKTMLYGSPSLFTRSQNFLCAYFIASYRKKERQSVPQSILIVFKIALPHLFNKYFLCRGEQDRQDARSRVRKKENTRTCTPSADKTDDEGSLVCYTVTELDWLMACNQAEWGIEFHSEFDREMLKSLSNEIIWAKNWKASLASLQATGKRNMRVRQRQKPFQKECFCVTVSSGLKNSLLDKGRDLGCLKKETAASPHQAFPQDQDGIPGPSFSAPWITHHSYWDVIFWWSDGCDPSTPL